MQPSVYQEYLDNEVLTAEPVKLIQLMYRGALDSIAGARAALAMRDIHTRSRLISKALAIISELSLSLDHSKDAELCGNLARLYAYMARRLIEANVKQIDEPLAEVARLLGDILEAWQQVQAQSEHQTELQPEPQPETYRPTAYAAEAGADHQGVSYAW